MSSDFLDCWTPLLKLGRISQIAEYKTDISETRKVSARRPEKLLIDIVFSAINLDTISEGRDRFASPEITRHGVLTGQPNEFRLFVSGYSRSQSGSFP